MSLFLALISDQDEVLFGLSVGLVLCGLCAFFFYSLFKSNRRVDVSPYSGSPLRIGSELTFVKRDAVLRYMREIQDVDNRGIDLNKAAFCRETGRIFPDCVSWTGRIRLDWSFITKRFPGHFLSWGSLSPERRKEIRAAHGNLYGFQTEISSTNPSPRLVEEEIAFAKPGPLYVDPDSGVLLGWKCVPGTELEVLVVQRPLKVKLLNIKQ